jgi:hypothetical protein
VLAKIPKAARANTREGAQAFAEFFFDQIVLSFVKADPTLLDGLYTESCKTCAAFRNTAAGFKEKGTHQAKPSFLVERVAIRRYLEEEQVKMIEVRGKQVVVDIVDSDGKQVGKTKPGEVTFILSLEWRERWVPVAAVVEG